MTYCQHIYWTQNATGGLRHPNEGRDLVQWLKLPTWKVGDRGFKPRSSKMFLPCSLVKNKYCGEPLWPRSRELGLRPPGLEFQILCLEGSVIAFISPSQEVLLSQLSLFVHKGGLKPHSFHLMRMNWAFILYILLANLIKSCHFISV